jgi:hypothetical protein
VTHQPRCCGVDALRDVRHTSGAADEQQASAFALTTASHVALARACDRWHWGVKGTTFLLEL